VEELSSISTWLYECSPSSSSKANKILPGSWIDMAGPNVESLLKEFVDGRTDLVFELVQQGYPPNDVDQDKVSLLRWCAYYGDVSAMKYLLSRGEMLDTLGHDMGLFAASFHGHWRLCKFLLEQGADVNMASPETGETPLHAALCKTDRVVYDLVVKVLLAGGANPDVITKDGVETGGFMRDCRTRAETPLHRAAAFGEEETIRLLLEAGAKIDAIDANGDTPLSWASWYLRPDPILRLLCYGDYRISPGHRPMRDYLLGTPHA
jgi:ankyrin repeat protein